MDGEYEVYVCWAGTVYLEGPSVETLEALRHVTNQRQAIYLLKWHFIKFS